jgi:hypothetical protein
LNPPPSVLHSVAVMYPRSLALDLRPMLRVARHRGVPTGVRPRFCAQLKTACSTSASCLTGLHPLLVHEHGTHHQARFGRPQRCCRDVTRELRSNVILNAKWHMRKYVSVQSQPAKRRRVVNEQVAPPCTAKQANCGPALKPHIDHLSNPACGCSGPGFLGLMLQLHHSALFCTTATTARCLGWTHELCRCPQAWL